MTLDVVTTVITPAASYDLTDLPTIKDELSIAAASTQDDNWLKRGNTQASKAIANYCNRVLPSETVSDLIYLGRNRRLTIDGKTLQLTRWPVISIASVIEDAGLTSQTSLVLNTDYVLNAVNGQLVRLDLYGLPRQWTAKTVTAQYTAGYGSQITQATSIPATPGPYTVTVTNSATFAQDGGVSFVGGAALVLAASAPAAGQYSFVAATGVYTFNAADQGKSIAITYTYNQIPYDLVDATLRLVTMRFKQRGRDPMLVSESQPNLGDRRFWVGTVPGQKNAFPPEIEALLSSYCIPVVS